jgi:tetratricopeptide (TPR) repeat protein
MRYPVLIIASFAGLLMVAANALAQQQSQPPDSPQPQAKQQSSDSASQKKTDSKPASGKDDNPFPESVSRDAAKAAGNEPADTKDSKPGSSKDDNPFPESVSEAAAKAGNGSSDQQSAPAGDGKSPAAQDNPFPESVSRDAAKAAGSEPSDVPADKRDLPPGISSSKSSGTDANEPSVDDPDRAKKDTQVGSFYLKNGNYQGALLRYKDATASDPTNVEAIFGLAEAQRLLKNNAEAARNYQLYLDIVPNGPRAKQALKALKNLPPG